MDDHRVEITELVLSLQGTIPDRVGPALANPREADLNLVAARRITAKEKERIREKEKAKVIKAKAKRMPRVADAHQTDPAPPHLAQMHLAVVPDGKFADPS